MGGGGRGVTRGDGMGGGQGGETGEGAILTQLSPFPKGLCFKTSSLLKI